MCDPDGDPQPCGPVRHRRWANRGDFLRYERMHDLSFHKAYGAFVKGRKESLKTGELPGAPNEANCGGGPGEKQARAMTYNKAPVAPLGPISAPNGAPKGGEITPSATMAKALPGEESKKSES